MDTRARLVEAVIEAAHRCYGDLYPSQTNIKTLNDATAALRAHDAAAKPMPFGCVAVHFTNDTWGIENADRTHYLARKWWPFTGPDDGRRKWGNYATEQEALDALASAPPPPGWVEPSADDPQATPAAEATPEEIASANKGIPLEQRVNELDAWASRMAETVSAVKLRAAQHEMWVGDQVKTHEDQIEDLASRVAEVERQVIHESRCRVELEGGMESMHLRFTESIAALRRDVDAMREWSRTFVISDSMHKNTMSTRLSVVEANMNAAMGEGRESTPAPPATARYEVAVVETLGGHDYYGVRTADGVMWLHNHRVWKNTRVGAIALSHPIAAAVARVLEEQP